MAYDLIRVYGAESLPIFSAINFRDGSHRVGSLSNAQFIHRLEFEVQLLKKNQKETTDKTCQTVVIKSA